MSGKVLVVDDEESILFALGDYLELRGYEVETARSLEEALSRIAETTYAAVVTDLRLTPEDRHGGIELAAAVRRRDPATRTLLLTGYRSSEVDEEARQAGVDRVLVKPMPLADIAGVLFELLG
jgi:DNA-binding NtrC family response regulator